jgi:surfeit locus 1 family protein
MRRPSPSAIFVTLTALLVTLSLGVWQLQRLAWKQDLMARMQAGLAATPLPLAAHLDNLADLNHRAVIVQGRFLHDLEAHIGPRSYRGQVGLHVLTPLRMKSGATVLINRGWIPNQRRNPASRALGQTAGPVTIRGTLRSHFERGGWTPDHDKKFDLWFWYDIPGIAAARNLELPAAVVLADGQANAGGLPVGGVARPVLRNNHVQYAITWFFLAAVVAVIFLLAHRRREAA